MHVDRIRVRSFGRLHGLDTGSQGLGDLVVVLGPNEGGKTTLFHFLATALYGFHPAARDAHPYAPWNGSELDGSAVRIVRARTPRDGRGARLVAHLRGRGDVPMSTDEIMVLTRED